MEKLGVVRPYPVCDADNPISNAGVSEVFSVMDGNLHTVSDSDDSIDEYIPLHKRLNLTKSGKHGVELPAAIESQLPVSPECRSLTPPAAHAAASDPYSIGGGTAAAANGEHRQFEREEKRRKEVQKRQRQADAAVKRSLRPEHCQKNLHVSLDARLLELDGGAQLLAALQASDVTVHVTGAAAAALPAVVTWQRDVTYSNSQLVGRQDEDQVVAVLDAGTTVSLIEQQMAGGSPTLTECVQQLRRQWSERRLTLLCWGIDRFCRTKTLSGCYRQPETGQENGASRRKKRAPKLDRLQLEAAVVDTLLDTGCNLEFVDTPEDGGLFLTQMSKAIAEAPFKRRRAAAPGWLPDSELPPVKVDRQLRGLRRLWPQQLRQLPASSLEAAQAIADVYRSPRALLKAYSGCNVEQQRQLVADLSVRRCVGPLVSSRRVGAELSRRLHLSLTAIDATAQL